MLSSPPLLKRGLLLQTLFWAVFAQSQTVPPTEESIFDFLFAPSSIMTVHKYGMLFIYGFLIEVVFQLGRYQKHTKYATDLHEAFGYVINSCTLFSFVATVYTKWGNLRSLVSDLHFYLGILTLILITLQTSFGAQFSEKMKGTKQTSDLPLLSKLHMIGGITLYIVSKIEVALGVIMFRPAYVNYLYAYYGALFVLRIAQEINYRSKRKLNGKRVEIIAEDSQVESHKKLMSLLNNNTPSSVITAMDDLKTLKWTILDDKVFELKDFHHPGGNFVYEPINGKEIGRYIYGSYGLFVPQQITQYAHSTQIFDIIKRNFIGTIKNGHGLFQLKEGEDNHLQSSGIKRNRLISSGHGDFDWVLENFRQISPLVTKFEFKCRKFYINPNIKDITQLGKHVKISHGANSKVRLYTLVLSQTEFRAKRREYLWTLFTRTNNTPIDQSNDKPTDTLPLIIKNYEIATDPTFSSFLHKSLIGLKGFHIEGPYGNGLELTPKSTGIHYVFTAGTGIYPFVDLFDFLLEAAIDNTSGRPNIFESGFKLHVFASFAKLEDFVGLDICEKLIQVCKKNKMKDAFKLTIKASNGKPGEFYELTEEKFNLAFIEKVMNKDCQKVYVCGPPQFNEDLPKDLKSVGISQEKILVV